MMTDNDFTPIYKNLKSKVIKELRTVGKGKNIILAADYLHTIIAWHCGNLFKTNYKERNRIHSTMTLNLLLKGR